MAVVWWSRLAWSLLGLAVACGESSHGSGTKSGGPAGDAASAGTGGANPTSGAGGTAGSGASSGAVGASALGGAAGASVAGTGSRGAAQSGGGGDLGAAGAEEEPVRTELGVDGYERVEMIAISDDGTYVVGNVTGAGDAALARGVRWKDTVPTLLEPQEGWREVYPQAISADGSLVVGRLFTASDSYGFTWNGTTAGLLQGLEGLSFGSDALAVSGDGKLVLGSVRDENLQGYAAAWRDGSLELLPQPTGFERLNPVATSFDGTESVGTGEEQGAPVSVRWVRDGSGGVVAQAIDDVVEVDDVSGDGRWFVGIDASGMFRRETTGSTTEPIPPLDDPSFVDCRPAATNATGSIVVGNCQASFPGGSGRGFLWSEKRGTVTVDSVFDTLGISVYPWCAIVDVSADSSTLLLTCSENNDMGRSISLGVRLRLAGAFD